MIIKTADTLADNGREPDEHHVNNGSRPDPHHGRPDIGPVQVIGETGQEDKQTYGANDGLGGLVRQKVRSM